jgi:hypothetical protein
VKSNYGDTISIHLEHVRIGARRHSAQNGGVLNFSRDSMPSKSVRQTAGRGTLVKINLQLEDDYEQAE